MTLPSEIEIVRKAKVEMHCFTDYFRGFEKIEAVKQIFGEKTDKVLSNLKIEFSGRRGYMGVSEDDGHLIVSAHYLNKGDEIDIYLDVIHELVHVKQQMEGRELFDNNYNYVDRPTEIEAYHVAVAEARRLGLSEERICEYLRTEWMSDEEWKRLATAMKIKLSDAKLKWKSRRRIV
ncbi:hypothetical protein KEJ15_02240 [Candidatus Bathyarchaeota archaeon]|nr:hypothetical protein [Candidatus Bathyarchaeota archaeon]